MLCYQSTYTTIRTEENFLVQEWSNKQVSIEEFQSEMLRFRKLFKQESPKHLLFDIKNCTLTLPDSLNDWMTQEVFVPLYKSGIQQLNLTLADQLPVHLSIADKMNKAKPFFQSNFFSHSREAIQQCQLIPYTPQETIVSKSIDNSYSIQIKTSSTELPSVLKQLQRQEEHLVFREKNRSKFQQLTPREIEILEAILKGYSNKQVGQIMFIEESSVKTHRKNIKRKLNITSPFDLYLYGLSFGLI